MHALISDIHSNFESFNRFFDKFRGEDIICLGDIVGYGPMPKECIELLKQKGIISVIGNHDFSFANNDFSKFSRDYEKSAVLSLKDLNSSDLDFLKKLPDRLKLKIGVHNVYAAHGSPISFWEYVHYDTSAEILNKFLEITKCDVILLGHTHCAFFRKVKNGFILNPGSIGQPRDGNPNACYMEVDFNEKELKPKIIRYSYDIDSTARKIKEKGLNEFYADRLYKGF